MATVVNDYMRVTGYEMPVGGGTDTWVLNTAATVGGITATVYSGGIPDQNIPVPPPPTGVMAIGGKRQRTGVEPQVYFRYVKRKFKLIECTRLNKRLRLLEEAFDAAVKNGQDVLAEKFLNEFSTKVREARIAAAGVQYYIEKNDLFRYKHMIRDGHISDTLFKSFTRVIPKRVLKLKAKVEDVFDDFVIYHYWDEKAKDVATMTPEEKNKMKDPILFGIIKETNRLYFIADWVDDHCDLTFEEITAVVARQNV